MLMAEIIQLSQIAAPSLGESFADPAFGTRVTHFAAAVTEYPTVNCFNCDNTKVLLVKGGDHFGLYQVSDGALLNDLYFIAASSEPRWDLHDSDLLFFHDPGGSALKSLNVATGEVLEIRPFHGAITFGRGEGDLIEDRLPIVVDGRYVSVYNVKTGYETSTFDAIRQFDSVYAVSAGFAISWDENGAGMYQGIELYDDSGQFVRQLTNAGGHHDICLAIDGSPLMLWTSSDERPDTIPDCPNAIRKVDIETGKQACLLSLEWQIAVHISCPDQAGWCLVECYQAPDAAWGQYSGELLRVWFNGKVDRIAHHRSTVDSYASQPKAVVSRDGTIVAFTSNMSGELHTYLIRLDSTVSAPLPLTIEQRVARLEAEVAKLLPS